MQAISNETCLRWGVGRGVGESGGVVKDGDGRWLQRRYIIETMHSYTLPM